MPSPADRFTQMQKIAIFLISIGEERTREVLVDLDFDTLEEINRAISSLGELTPQEKASVMIEFGDMFFKDVPLKSKIDPPAPPPPPQPPAQPSREPQRSKQRPLPPQSAMPSGKPPSRTPNRDRGAEHRDAQPSSAAHERRQTSDEEAARQALRHLKQHVDPGKIDWSRAGYDFGEGFGGHDGGRKR